MSDPVVAPSPAPHSSPVAALRSEDWTVYPTFVPHAPNGPVTLLVDGTSLTQVVGDPPVAWQTPWSALSNVQLVRFRRSLALFATADGVRYCWRTTSKGDFESLRSFVRGVGGSVERYRRRAGVYGLAIVVLVSALSGTGVAWLNRRAGASMELRDARAVNLTIKDLPSGFAPLTSSVLSYLFQPSTQVVTSTSTTAPKPNSVWTRITKQFQSCMGVSNARDRVYGAAGQMPDYQVASPLFGSANYGGLEVASETQYYATTAMVAKDTKEMSSPKFGACFVASQASVISSAFGLSASSVASASSWQPLTFAKGFTAGGVVTLDVQAATKLQLVMAVVTSGHYEVTFGAVVSSFKKSDLFLANLVNTLKSRITSTNATAV